MRHPSPVQRAPRRLSVAVGLSVLMPGLGHLYCGRVRRGLCLWAMTFGVFLVALTVWVRALFVPVAPAAVLFVAWCVLQLACGAELRRFIKRHGADYQIHPLNHPVSYVAVLLGLAVLPTVVAIEVVGRVFVGSVAVVSDGNFPSLIAGDRVLFDRAGYAERAPVPGELVVLGWPSEGALVARVIATEGQTVHLRSGRPVVDGRPLVRRPLERLEVPRLEARWRAHLERHVGFLERVGDEQFVALYEPSARRALDPPPVKVGADEIYVLSDNRATAVQERLYGRVPLAAIQGRPRFVWASFDGSAPRLGRIGLTPQ